MSATRSTGLVERYQRPVHALLWRMACARGDSHVADLVQDALIRVVAEHRPVRSGPARLSTWILTIATRIVLNDRRRDGVRMPEILPASYIDPATAAADREIGVVIARAVADLADHHRVVLVLREYHDLDYADIARVLDLDAGTVKSRLSRARAALRETLMRTHPDLVRGTR